MGVKQQIILPGPPTAETFRLANYDRIVVNSSAGKDSQSMLDYVVERADAEGVRDRLVVLHCDLGKSPGGQDIEWPGTKELAREHAEHYGLRFIVVRRGVRGFLEQVDYRDVDENEDGLAVAPEGVLRVDGSYKVYDEGGECNGRLLCMTPGGDGTECLNEFPLPVGPDGEVIELEFV